MIKVLFVCHGNICRSTMAQSMFQDIVNKKGLSDRFEIDSAATSFPLSKMDDLEELRKELRLC